jgi:hypothetical protein
VKTKKKAPFLVVFQRKVPAFVPGEFVYFRVDYPCYSRKQAFELRARKLEEYFDTTLSASIFDNETDTNINMEFGGRGVR